MTQQKRVQKKGIFVNKFKKKEKSFIIINIIIIFQLILLGLRWA